MQLLKMTDLQLKNKRVLIREDLNVPIHDGKVTSDARVKAAIPTIEYALEKGAAVILMSHLGRPAEGEFSEEASLAPVAALLSKELRRPVRLEKNWLEGVALKSGEVVLCENVRFNKGEKANDPTLAKKIASLCDIFVMDAFATAHRKHASTYGVSEYAPIACAGPLLDAELEALERGLTAPNHPVVAIVGGSKIATKLGVLNQLLRDVDCLILGGGIANTLLAASGYSVGRSLYEKDWLDKARELMKVAKEKKILLPLPTDVIVSTEMSENAVALCKPVSQIAENEMILDIGPKTAENYASQIAKAATVLWNGPVGVFEIPAFSEGTQVLAKAIAASKAFSIAGGGDTLAAIEKFGVEEGISYISTGGGAFLEYIERKTLPAVDILEKRARSF